MGRSAVGHTVMFVNHYCAPVILFQCSFFAAKSLILINILKLINKTIKQKIIRIIYEIKRNPTYGEQAEWLNRESYKN